MAEDNDKDQKTERATEKRRRESREKGQFAQSQEISFAAIILAIIFSLYFFGQYMLTTLMVYTKESLSGISSVNVSVANAIPLFYQMIKVGVLAMAPILLILAATSLLVSFIQGGGIVFAVDPITPKFSKLNPIEGVKKLFSLNAFVDLVKSSLKIVIVGYAAYKTVKGELTTIPSLVDMENAQILQYVSHIALKIMINTFIAIIFLAIVDYMYQLYRFEEDMKMTKEEVKNERKDAEGSPQVKSKIRSIQLETARKRMMEAIPTADVIITNPTHIAVAIKYDREKMAAPVVVAKGAGFVAEKIKKIGKESDVPIVQDIPVARMLYKIVKVGEAVPFELYKAIAEILAYVYQLKGKSRINA